MLPIMIGIAAPVVAAEKHEHERNGSKMNLGQPAWQTTGARNAPPGGTLGGTPRRRHMEGRGEAELYAPTLLTYSQLHKAVGAHLDLHCATLVPEPLARRLYIGQMS